MLNEQMIKYQFMNNLAEGNGIVILGGEQDYDIPTGELRQAFAIDSNIYNRSIPGLSVQNAAEVYDTCVADIYPDTLFLHLGSSDMNLFQKDPAKFDAQYRTLISHIKKDNKNCELVLVAMKNPENCSSITEMNRHIKLLANSEKCKYGDIETKRVWNPKETKDVMSFVYSLGFIRNLRNKRPIYDLLKILFLYDSAYAV